MTRSCVVAIWFVSVVAGCTSKEPAKACVPGQQIACACAGGGNGAQACKDDGSGFGQCQCASAATRPAAAAPPAAPQAPAAAANAQQVEAARRAWQDAVNSPDIKKKFDDPKLQADFDKAFQQALEEAKAKKAAQR